VGGGQTPEVKNKQGYKILAQNYMQLGHLEYERKVERSNSNPLGTNEGK